MADHFIVGAEYPVRSICDWECIFRWKVIDRTNKFITVTNGGPPKRVGVRVWDGVEVANPLGRYSMAPTIRADRTEV